MQASSPNKVTTVRLACVTLSSSNKGNIDPLRHYCACHSSITPPTFLNVSTLGGNPGSGYGEEADSVPSLSDAESEDGHEEVDELREQVAILTAERTEQANTIQALQEQLEEAKQRMRTLWRTSCTQLEECDRTLAEKDAQIAELSGRVELLDPGVV